MLLLALGVTLTVLDHRSVVDNQVALGCVVGFGNAVLGGFVLTRHPGNPIGFLFAFGGLSRAVSLAAGAWSTRALETEPGSLPGGSLASWLQAWTFLPGIAVLPMFVVLFPDGRLPGRRWRVVPALSGVALVLLAVIVPIGLWRYRGEPLLPDSPIPAETQAHVVVAAMVVGIVVAVVGIVLGLAALAGRARRSAGEVRQQVKWFAYGAGCGLVLNFAGDLTGVVWISLLGATAVLTGIGLGIFRYRLYDIDRLINRTAVYGAVSVALVAGFAALDVTLAAIVGRDSVAIAAVSAFVVALLLRPGRDRAQHLVDRIFDRRSHDAVSIMRALGQRVGQEPVGPDAVRAALRRSLRDPSLCLYLYLREADVLVDGDGRRVGDLPVAAGQVVDPVTQDGQNIALLVHAPTEPALLRAVVRAGAVVLEHARLQAELLVQLAEVRASRARLAAAGDIERRRIERDLHDGAQQRLVGLALHLQSAKRRSSYPAEFTDLLTFATEQLHAGVEDIRALVHGILPPALAASGLAAALAELARPGEVAVSCGIPARLEPGVEATAWFVACEGVANAVKHASGHLVRVDVSVATDRLLVEVSDDGPGGADADGDGLRNLADRVEAHGGSLRVESPRGAGTRLHAELPCAS
ncbi:MAG TPA: histidine kinase [Actinophytocola sp.]|nr:histidine kinase [Actinophytocola sp.]